VIFADGKQWEAQRGNLGLLGAHDLGRAALFIAERSGWQMEYP
jgi:hypothetical protein